MSKKKYKIINKRKRRTFTRFPIICQHVAFGTSAISSAERVETRVRTAAIVRPALVNIFAQMSISCQLSSWHILAAAMVGAVSVVTGALARAVTIAQRAFINI